ncbi:MAG: pentapeptide repeat-containing protein, partial [Planctomycetota bacterium]
MEKQGELTPRVLSPECGYAFGVEEVVGAYENREGVIALLGPFGSDRGRALAVLRERLPHAHLLGPDTTAQETRSLGGLVVYARETPLRVPHLAQFRMAPWGREQILDYLMTCYPARCGDVLARVESDPGRTRLGHSARLWRSILDGMAERETDSPSAALDRLARGAKGGTARHRVVRVRRIADRLATRFLVEGSLRTCLDRDVLHEAAARMRSASDELRARFERGEEQAMAASLLLALDEEWRPSGERLRLGRAMLAGARWASVALRHADLRAARLGDADLEGADLSFATARRA